MMSRGDRFVLAQICAASRTEMFRQPECRGLNWHIDKMPRFIKEYIETQAFLSNITNKKHIEAMISVGLDFYNKFLMKPLIELVKLQAAQQGIMPDIPLCATHAAAWFTERNMLPGSHKCVVCAFDTTEQTPTQQNDQSRGLLW